MKRALGYIRVSTGEQANGGLSLEAQRAKIRAQSAVSDLDLVDVIVDAGESAKTLDRPGAQRLLEAVRYGSVDVVVIAKLDRLTRSVKDLADLIELFSRTGVSLVSVAETLDTGTATGRMVMNLITTVSQWEREAISERTRDVLTYKRSMGMRTGTVRYGWRSEGKGLPLVKDEGEQMVLARVRELRDLGETYRGIAETLNAEGKRTRAGGEWKFQYIANILRERE